MVWGSISINGLSPLVRVSRRLNGDGYLDILQ